MAERIKLSDRDTSGISKAIFFDRDGVIGFNPSEADYVKNMYELEMNPAVYELFKLIDLKQHIIIVVTNQRGIQRGLYTKEDLEDISDLANSYLNYYCGHGVDFLYYCPHGNEDNCDCRKPGPGMFRMATNEHNLDKNKCFVIGDKYNDIEAAKRAGIFNTCLVETNHPEQAIGPLKLFIES